jgi:hypothetical protein
MNSSNTQANTKLFKQAKEHYLPMKIINLAKTGTTSERLRYVLSEKIVSVNKMSTLCSVPISDVIYFLFKYDNKLDIYTHFENNTYYFTSSSKIINHLKSLKNE